MIRYRRRNTPWLVALGALVAIVLASGNVPFAAQAFLMAAFAVALVGSLVDFKVDNRKLRRAIQERSSLMRGRISPQAREAVARASSRGGYFLGDITLADVGMIAAQTGAEGMVMRRTRSISKDDDGVRPFIALLVTPDAADRNATIRFEVIDHHGKQQYIHEMKTFLRDGEINILADHHLPLIKNPQIEGMGDWDLRVFIDGRLVAIHGFALTPSSEERSRRLTGQPAGRYYVTESEQEELPLSLEELLRNQGQQSNQRRG